MYSLYIENQRVAVADNVDDLQVFLEFYFGEDWSGKSFHIKHEDVILSSDTKNIRKVRIEKIKKVLEKNGRLYL